jgi:cysteine desulfurase/selenocysteine lyase
MDIEKIRKQFPALNQKINGKDIIYFDNAATSLKPASVTDAIADYYNTINSNVHRASHYLSSMSTQAYEKSREIVAEFINANPGEIIFTGGTTDSLNILANGLSGTVLNEGDEIILTTMEHHSNVVPWVALKNKKGIVIRVLNIDDSGILKTDELEFMISDKTKLISFTHSSNVLGTINPVKDIVKIARKHGIISIIDGAQAVAHCKVDVEDIDCDFYCFSGHKMYGPMGIGVLYGKKEMLEKLTPFRYGGGMIGKVSFDDIELSCLPNRLEAGTPFVSGAVGLSESVKLLQNIGFEAISNHESELCRYATERLREIPGLQIFGDNDNKDPIISFIVEGIHHTDIVMILDNSGIAVRSGQHCAQPLMARLGQTGTIRMSFAFYNKTDEIDFFIEMLKRAILMLK